MKILNVIVSIDPVTGGGMAERSIQISRYLVRAGHSCTILTIDTGLSTDYLLRCRKWGLSIVALPCIWRRFYLPQPALNRINKLVASADVVNIMGHWTIINALVYRAIKKFEKPYTACPAGALHIFGRSKIKKNIYNNIIGRKILFHATGCIAISPNEIKHFELYGIPRDKVSEIPNGIDPDDYPETDGKIFREKYHIDDAPFILFMGRLNIIKGPDMLLEAFFQCSKDERMNKYHLVFAGPDEGMLIKLRQMVEVSCVKDRVHFIGHIGKSEKNEAFRAADFLAIPSRQEAMSIVVLEAGIAGTPVMITDQCGFDKIESVAGGLVVTASVEGIIGGLLAMTANPEKLKIMGQNLMRYTREYFLWDHIVIKYLELFSKIL